MKYRFLAFLASVSVCASAFAAKPTTYVQEFNNVANVKPGWVEVIRGAVLEGIVGTDRTVIVDAITESSRYEEEMRRLQENIATDDLSTTEALKTRGSHVLLSGDITALSVPGTRSEKTGNTTYDATVTFTLKLVNASDGALLATKTYTLPKRVMGFGSDIINVYYDEDSAVQGIKGSISKAMKGFVEEAYPLEGPIEDVDELSKNGKEVKTFYIGLGSEDGLSKGVKLDIKLVQKIGKKTAAKIIGEAEVKEVAGEDISLCEVKKGGLEVKAALDAGQTVIVSSKKK